MNGGRARQRARVAVLIARLIVERGYRHADARALLEAGLWQEGRESLDSALRKQLKGRHDRASGRVLETVADSRFWRALERDCDWMELEGHDIWLWGDPDYPSGLASIAEPPAALFLLGRGRQALADGRLILTVVGTRSPGWYGQAATEHFVRPLAAAGCSIVSGMALGIDGLAHRAALEAGGRTVAVLACGVDHVYPPEHVGLYAAIQERGLILSEFPPGSRPRRSWFPARNRLLSGLGAATLVMEAGRRSGTLITVEHALEQGRDVYALPGSIFSPESRGPNHLLSEGAGVLLDVEQLLENLAAGAAGQQAVRVAGRLRQLRSPEAGKLSLPRKDVSPQAGRLLEILGQRPANLRELESIMNCGEECLLSCLQELESAGLAELRRGRYVRRSPVRALTEHEGACI
ncbi:MAG: DNA-processing protein DprA [Bacillota bacterium]|nr:DNA-processing protein DprA [Bacillota bacterium]